MSFEHTLTARFFEIDRAGIVFFGRFFEYCHATFEEMLLAALPDWNGAFDHSGWGMPLVHAEADFSRPVRMGDRLRIAMDAGAKQVLIPTVNASDFASIPPELLDKLRVDFYSEPLQAAFKAIAEA